ncbi:MAG: bifunctional hydroxymethylpyrimidine kinase/phosphomethylpyrimidine kinase [Desulfococcaceae bacterium]
MKTALTIAGSDPCAGAGIQADLKTFQAHGIYGLSVITAVTVQNTQKVYDVQKIRPEIVYGQIRCLLEDMEIHAVKIGMIPDTAVTEAIADALRSVSCPIILDPVMISTSGFRLMSLDTQQSVIKKLFPLLYALTPNIPEAEVLCGEKIENAEQMKTAARKILETGVKRVVIKGGHLRGDTATDLAWDGIKVMEFSSLKIKGKEVHGTGCTFSSSLAANLALGRDFFDAAARAGNYTGECIRKAFSLGKGSLIISPAGN